MKIWVDADACPVVIKKILFRAAERTGVPLTLVANQPIHIPPSRYIKFIQVSSGFDVADNEIYLTRPQTKPLCHFDQREKSGERL
jgi:uncharacterized protein YaiI (UPF0178 family)